MRLVLLLSALLNALPAFAAGSFRDLAAKRAVKANARIADYLKKPDFNRGDDWSFDDPNHVNVFASPDWKPGMPMILFVAEIDPVQQPNTRLMVVYADTSKAGVEEWKKEAAAILPELNSSSKVMDVPSAGLSPVFAEEGYTLAGLWLGRIGSQTPNILDTLERLMAKTTGWKVGTKKKVKPPPQLQLGSMIVRAGFPHGPYLDTVLAQDENGFIVGHARGDGTFYSARYVKPQLEGEIHQPVKSPPFDRILVWSEMRYLVDEHFFEARRVLYFSGTEDDFTVATTDGKEYFDFDSVVGVKPGETYSEAIARVRQKKGKDYYPGNPRVDEKYLNVKFDSEKLIAAAKASLCEKKLASGKN